MDAITLALDAPMSLGAREPPVEGLALPKSLESGSLSFSKTGIRWMSDKARFAVAKALIPKQEAS
jgi:hypothetical protein